MSEPDYPGDPNYRTRQVTRAVGACCVLFAKDVPKEPGEDHDAWRDRVARYAAPRVTDRQLLWQRNVGPVAVAAFRYVYGPYQALGRWQTTGPPLRPEDV